MDIIEAMRQRRSVRSFDGTPLTPDQTAALNDAAVKATSPFGGHVSIRLERFDLKGPYKPSTYGTIKGASDFFLVALHHDDESALTAGYTFEQVVLRAWQMGLGTCWIAATFKGSEFDKGQQWPDGEELTVICPVGTADKPNLRERMTRTMLRSNNRKPFGELFFEGDFSHPLSEDSRFGEALQMMRLAPSSTNSQPWRALVVGNTVHFYYKPKSRASVLDCGIGLCHFHLTEQFNEQSGQFFNVKDAPSPIDDWRYLVTWVRE